MVGISFTVDGVTELSRNLRIAIGEVDVVLDNFASSALDIIKERSDELFENEWSNVQNGDPWKPLAPSTLKARERKRWHYKNTPSGTPGVLSWTRNLRDNVTKTIGSNEGRLKWNADYAPKHQQGDVRTPRRKFVDIDRTTAEKIVKELQKELLQQVGIFGRQIL